MTDTRLQTLVDRADLSDLVYRYAQAIDRRDWGLLRSCFTDEMEADFRSFGVREVFRGLADDWVALVRSTIEGCDSTQHQSSNHRFEVDGDHAQGSSYIRAEHVVINDRGDNHYTVAGYYEHEFRRTTEGWRTAKYTLRVTSSFGNRHVLALATRRAARMAEDRA